MQRYLSFSGNNNRIDNYCYDAAGNLLKEAGCPVDMNTVPYKYDAENRMITGDGAAWTYKYDAEGKRIQKLSSAGNHYDDYYDLSGRLVTSYYSGGWSRSEIFAGAMHLATYEGGITIFHHTDWLGSERRNTDQTGTLTQTCTGLAGILV